MAPLCNMQMCLLPSDMKQQSFPTNAPLCMLYTLVRIVFTSVCCILMCGLASPTKAAIHARAAILLNMDTGQVLFAKNPNLSIPPASLTKVMTMFLTMDMIRAKKLNIAKKVRITKSVASVRGSSMHLRAGERVAVSQLLTGAAVASGNDAATALARCVSGNDRRFVRAMNQKARSLGMHRTVFKNPTGLPAAGQKTTASDMAILARAYLKTHPQAQSFHSRITFSRHNRTFTNTNTLLRTMHGVNGLKTGWTVASGYNIIVTAKRGNTHLLGVVLGSPTRNARDNTAKRILEAGFKNKNYPKKIRQTLR